MPVRYRRVIVPPLIASVFYDPLSHGLSRPFQKRIGKRLFVLFLASADIHGKYNVFYRSHIRKQIETLKDNPDPFSPVTIAVKFLQTVSRIQDFSVGINQSRQ